MQMWFSKERKKSMDLIKRHQYLFSAFIFGIVFVLWYLLFIIESNTIRNVYYLIALGSFASVFYLIKKRETLNYWKKNSVIPSLILSVLFSLTLLAPLYPLFFPLSLGSALKLIASFLVSVLIFFPLCLAAFTVLDHDAAGIRKRTPLNSKRLFALCFVCFVLVDVIFLYASYPGVLTPDSISQINQSMSGEYVNHHPFWHTIIISGIIHLGSSLFHDMNAAAALYSACQILFVAASFSFVIVTVNQACEAKALVWASFFFFLLAPYHISYSATMWKDIPFALATMLFTAFLYRILFHVGGSRLNYIGFIISAVLFGSWRTNGLIALIITSIVLVILLIRKRSKKMLITVVSVLLVTVLMNTVFFGLVGVKSAKFSEKLSIPLQQVARVVKDGNRLDAYEIKMINELLDYHTIPQKYNSRLSDPIKFSIDDESDQYLQEHKWEYLTLWLRIGLRYPAEYIKAWIDQTKGYWSTGYDYWRWASGVYKNTYGIKEDVKLPTVRKMFDNYFDYWEDSFLNVLLSIGLFTSFYVFAFVYLIARKKLHFILTIPVISVIMTLMIAAPVYSEFRYAYSLFTCFPLLILLLISCNKQKAGDKQISEDLQTSAESLS